jgi:hypothetical protein
MCYFPFALCFLKRNILWDFLAKDEINCPMKCIEKTFSSSSSTVKVSVVMHHETENRLAAWRSHYSIWQLEPNEMPDFSFFNLKKKKKNDSIPASASVSFICSKRFFRVTRENVSLISMLVHHRSAGWPVFHGIRSTSNGTEPSLFLERTIIEISRLFRPVPMSIANIIENVIHGRTSKSELVLLPSCSYTNNSFL